MKTEEEKKTARDARDARILKTIGPALPRTGYIPRAKQTTTEPAPALQGLELGPIDLWPLDRFTDHPSNHVFDSSKTEAYWRDLRRDILEAGAIINPVIALPDGTLLEGHSRLRIARELAAEGKALGKIPVRLVASPITPAEAERRVYLGNLSRFELDDDTRLTLYAKVWPDYFGQKGKPGPVGNSGHRVPISREIAEQVGKSEKQVKRDRAVAVEAEEERQAEGAPTLKPEHVKKAREKVNAARREKAKKAAPPASAARSPVTLKLSRETAETLLRILRTSKASAAREAVQLLKKALGGKL